MIFSSINFLFYFLPIVLILYYFIPAKFITAKNLVLLIASLFFYYCGEQMLVLLMLFSSVTDYCCSFVIEKYRSNKHIMKIALLTSIIINLGLLGYFKYADFLIRNVNSIFRASIPALGIALPIGISFYTFQTMSYTIDVYWGNTKAQHNPITFASYVTLFPQLIAGPIVRYLDVERELKHRKHTIEDFSYGIRRFIIGLSKKVLIANTFAELGKSFIDSNQKTILFYWMYAIAFTIQIYFDFSGYSDMAIGLGGMFGFKFLENFNYPYTAKTVTDFWRRWHMSLSTWFRDYVYIPLGGNRVSKTKWVRNIFIVWFLTGFWHGAEWNFIVWGLFFAVFLLAEKTILSKFLASIPSFLTRIYTLFIVLFGFVIFRANSMTEALHDIGAMFGMADEKLSFAGLESLYFLKSYAFLFVVAAIAATPIPTKIVHRIRLHLIGSKVINIMEPIVLMFLLLWVTGCLIDGSFNPFLYFRF